MAGTYNIANIFQSAFGIKSPIYIPETFAKQNESQIDFSGVRVVSDETQHPLSWLGTPIIFPITFNGGTYQKYDVKGNIVDEKREDYRLPAACIAEFSRPKIITKTNVLGGEGSVKEIFSLDDWKITIKGVCLDEPGNTAKDQIESILQWEYLVSAIGVTGELFVQKDIHAIVIEDINVPQVQAKPKVMPFELRCLSDNIINLDYGYEGN